MSQKKKKESRKNSMFFFIIILNNHNCMLIDSQGGIMGVCVAQKSSKTLVACFPNNMRPGLSQICTGVNLPHEGRQTFKNNNSDGRSWNNLSLSRWKCIHFCLNFVFCSVWQCNSVPLCCDGRTLLHLRGQTRRLTWYMLQLSCGCSR